MPLGRLRITYTGGLSPARLRPRRRRPDPGRRPRRDRPAPRHHRRRSPCPGPATSAARSPASRPPRTRENVVALARAHANRAPPRRCSPTPSGSSARAPAPTSSSSSTARLHTPPLASGCLAGITRALAVEWAGAKETDLPLDVLERAEEIFLTSTLRDVQAVHRVDGRELPGAPGPGDRQGHADLRRAVGADIDP